MGIALRDGEKHVGTIGGLVDFAKASFMRPDNTTAYASADLVANSTSAGLVAPMTFTVGRKAKGSGMIRRFTLRKSGTGVTNAAFRLHLYYGLPAVSNGDNSAWLSDGMATYIGSLDVTVDKIFTDGAQGEGVPTTGAEIPYALAAGRVIYGLLEARGAYTPGALEEYIATLEHFQN